LSSLPVLGLGALGSEVRGILAIDALEGDPTAGNSGLEANAIYAAIVALSTTMTSEAG